ncbi:MAG: hypothetical protein JWQ03_2288, partial [Variovorax sp.]|nr:hypothetical protein [Variovorax sp.]
EGLTLAELAVEVDALARVWAVAGTR